MERREEGEADGEDDEGVGEEEEEDGEGEDIVSKLFNFDLYEALQIVFLRCSTNNSWSSIFTFFQESD